MPVRYEWDAESYMNGEIVDHDHHDTFAKAFAAAAASSNYCEKVLVRDVFDGDGSLVERSWAYLDNFTLTLPVVFKDSYGHETAVLVPKRFQEEVERFLQKNRVVRYHTIHLPDGGRAIVWYERSEQVWYAAKKDNEGNQIGDSIQGSTRKAVEQYAADEWAKPKEGHA